MTIKKCSLLILICLILCGLNRNAVANNYTTSFSLAENPISEGGNWADGMVVGIDWSNVVTSSGMAYGTQMGNNLYVNEYSDSTALLTGTWGSNQTVQATVNIESVDTNADEEVELRLRQTLSAHSCTGYEVAFSANPFNQYIQVVRWDGALGNFSYVDGGDTAGYVVNGDVVKATICGTNICVYQNGTLLFNCSDCTYSNGNPGIGFFVYDGPCSDDTNYGFSRFYATDEIHAPTVLVPGIMNGQFLLSFQTKAAKSYAIQENADPYTTNWDTLTNVTGDGYPYQFIVPATNAPPSSFFRVNEP